MTLTVRFFASLREDMGCTDVTCSLPEAARLEQLFAMLQERFGERTQVLRAENVRIAINQELCAADPTLLQQTLRAGDEVAFLPPVTGG